METKWYSDYLALLIAPKTRGFQQAIEHGTTKKAVIGAAVAMFGLPVLLILVGALALLIASPFMDGVSFGSVLGSSVFFGAGAFFAFLFLAIGLVIMHAFIYLEAYIFKSVANRMGGQADLDSMVTNLWYITGYFSLLSLILEPIRLFFQIILAAFSMSGSDLSAIALGFAAIVGFVAVIVLIGWSIWFACSFTGQLVNLGKLQTFFAYVLTQIGMWFVLFLLFGLPILLIMSIRS